MHEHNKSGGSGQNVERKNTFLQAHEWKKTGCSCLLEVRCVVVGKDCTMPSPYFRKYVDSLKSRKNVGF